jgi:hypothetical protein
MGDHTRVGVPLTKAGTGTSAVLTRTASADSSAADGPRPLFDNETTTVGNEIYRRADAFRFRRRTYEIFAGSWGAMADHARRARNVRNRLNDVVLESFSISGWSLGFEPVTM